jgi:uncharacterized membrane protein
MIKQLLTSAIAKEIIVIMSALPIAELRGALPVATNLYHMPWYRPSLLAIIDNMLPIPALSLFLDSITKVISKVNIGKRLINWAFERTSRHGRIIETYQRVGLNLFVVVPLPLTSAWSGAIVA